MITEFTDNRHLYSLLEWQRTMMSPLNVAARLGNEIYGSPLNPLAYTRMGRTMAAGFELLERTTRQYDEPEWRIEKTVVEGKTVAVTPTAVERKTFCDLTHFRKETDKVLPKLLIVAPMSGHYATLLRGTVEGMLPFFDVTITDWSNARDIPIAAGSFDLDDYIDYVIEFLHTVGVGTHVMAVCQPSVPVLAAVALMAARNDPYAPRTMTLIGGPIDTRINPTEVNRHAETKPIEWFEQNVICHVPVNYNGFMRRVYPGFIQLTGFMTMNLDRHLGAHVELFNHLVEGDGESAESHREFYNEYLAVMDLPAEFYLQTIETVFKDHTLPNGMMHSRGRPVKPEKITKTALLCVEGERDDISGRGQTEAALGLCKNLPASMKKYHLQKNVGHYGTFNGRRFREEVVPTIRAFAQKHSA